MVKSERFASNSIFEPLFRAKIKSLQRQSIWEHCLHFPRYAPLPLQQQTTWKLHFHFSHCFLFSLFFYYAFFALFSCYAFYPWHVLRLSSCCVLSSWNVMESIEGGESKNN